MVLHLARVDFDSINKRTDRIDNPRTCGLVAQGLLKSGDFSSVEVVGQIGMDRDLLAPCCPFQVDLDLALARLQASASDRVPNRGRRHLR